MLRPIGYSVFTQALTSAGNFIISILIVRLASLESFGQYVYIFAIAVVASSITSSLTGGVYLFFRPRYARFARAYQRYYNGLNLLMITLVTILASAVAILLAPRHDPLEPYVIPLFVLSLICLDSFRLQASANGLHAVMFFTELGRLTAFGAILAVLSSLGPVPLGSIMTAQGATGIAACALLILAAGVRVSFRRLTWVAKRHIGYGRYLVPAGLIGFFHSGGLLVLASHHFGPQATGLLRLAELPFSALNPIKQSLAYFLPRALYDFDQRPLAEKRSRLGKLAIGCIAGSTILMVCAWIAAILFIPVLTEKDYPAGTGLIFCLAYVFAFLMTPLHMYLNTVDRARKVLEQTALGSAVALAVYFATYSSIGYMAAAVASCACFFAIIVVGAYAVAKHLSEGAPHHGADSRESPTSKTHRTAPAGAEQRESGSRVSVSALERQ